MDREICKKPVFQQPKSVMGKLRKAKTNEVALEGFLKEPPVRRKYSAKSKAMV